MPKLDARVVAGVVNAGGGPPAGTTVAQWVALADHESSYRSDVENGQYIGLWQIGYKLHAGKYGLPADQQQARQALKSPAINYPAAKQLFEANRSRLRNIKSGNWLPTWEGSAAPNSSHLAAAALPDQPSVSEAFPDGEWTDPLEEAIDTVTDVGGAISRGVDVVVDGAKWLTDVHNVMRVLYVVGGIVLGVVALSIVAKPVVNDAVKTVKPI